MTPRELWRRWRDPTNAAFGHGHRMWVVRFRLVGLVDAELAAVWGWLPQQARRDRAAMVLDKSPGIGLTVKRAAAEALAAEPLPESTSSGSAGYAP